MFLVNILFLSLLHPLSAFIPNQLQQIQNEKLVLHANSNGQSAAPLISSEISERRLFLQACCISAVLLSGQSSDATDQGKLTSTLLQVQEARRQLDPVPALIKDEKWDSVRAILITPPLSDCWSKTSKLLNSYAQAIGDELPDGDELAALEFKEDALDHLRFLDMAVYNNVFNPIKTEGESGATKELIRSYYEDPVNEVSSNKVEGINICS